MIRDVAETVYFIDAREMVYYKTAVKLKIIFITSICQARELFDSLRFRTSLWTCGETIDNFEVYYKTAAKLTEILIASAS